MIDVPIHRWQEEGSQSVSQEKDLAFDAIENELKMGRKEGTLHVNVTVIGDVRFVNCQLQRKKKENKRTQPNQRRFDQITNQQKENS